MSLGTHQNYSFDQDLAQTTGQVLAPFLANVNNGTIYYRYAGNNGMVNSDDDNDEEEAQSYL